MRCPDCKRFVELDDTAEPELNLQVDDFVVSGTARIVLTCGECGTELKEKSFDVEMDFTDEVEERFLPAGTDQEKEKLTEQVEMTIASESATLTSRVETTSVKKLKDGTVKTTPLAQRGWKTFYGVSVEVEVLAVRNDENGGGDAKFYGTYGDEVPVGEMEEMV